MFILDALLLLSALSEHWYALCYSSLALA